ncbi:MAG: polysaccharide pyruvyl transferase family protein [Verrucomicrobia bacterium]|nr:polysaccharide pyruvyl transferase family protein [Verrucomicrobiota bacterium]MDE3098020.1 polysaccharide pyruvyl transferase family protein [Verrucomicrobiota bacterium]
MSLTSAASRVHAEQHAPREKPLAKLRLRICVMGAAVQTENRGVLALGSSLVKLLADAAPDAEIIYLAGNRDSQPVPARIGSQTRPIPVINYRLSPKAPPRQHLLCIMALSLAWRLLPFSGLRSRIARSNPWIGAVAQAGLVGDIRGGDSFSDIYGLKRFVLGSLPVIAVLWVRRDIVLFPQTYGPFKHRLARTLAAYILRRSSCILSRDHDSMATVEGLIGKSSKVNLCPDVAFALEAIRPPDPQISPPLPSHVPCLIGLNVNGLVFHGGYNRRNMFGLKLNYPDFLARLVFALLDREGTRLLLVPHTFGSPGNVESDPEASRKLIELLPEPLRARVHLITAKYDQHEIKGLIGMCDFFIGSRMHSCIAALSQGIPAIAVAYSKKFKGVFDSIGVGHWVVDARNTNIEAALAETLKRFEERAEMKRGLADKVQIARQTLRETFAVICAGAVAT